MTKQKAQNLCVMRNHGSIHFGEMDFISNPEIEAQMGTSNWRERAAKDIYEGIMDYLGYGRQG